MKFNLGLDSLAYRWLWQFKSFLKIYPGPYPIKWNKSAKHNLYPPDSFSSQLSEEQKQNLKEFQREMEVLSKISTYIPERFTERHWNEVVELSSRHERLEYVKFIRKNEVKHAREQLSKQIKREEAVLANENEDAENAKETQNGTEGSDIYSQIPYRTFTHVNFRDEDRNMQTMRIAQAFLFQDRPAVVIDCRFLPELSIRARNLTFLQMAYLIADNKQRKDPWRVILANFDQSNKLVHCSLNRQLMSLNTKNVFFADVTPNSYLDLFERDRLIYLSPHTDEKLTAEEVQDERNVFIIGGIVDRVREPNLHPQASLVCAQEEEIRCRKFPLDDYIDRQIGNRYLTLTTVLQIIQNVYDTNGDWASTIEKYLPIRYKVPQVERNLMVHNIYDDRRKQWREIYRIIREKLDQ